MPFTEGGRAEFELYPIQPTAFSNDGAVVDVGAMSENAQRMAGNGITGLLLTGSYGEFQSLVDDERVAIVRAVRSASNTRIMACAALPSSMATAQLAKRLFDVGADLVMVSAPLVAELTDADVYRHFEYLAQQIAGPLVIYNNPVFGIDLSPGQLAELSKLPSVAAIKQGTKFLGGMVESIATVTRASEGRVKVLAASDMAASASLPAGVHGLTSTNSWVFPEVFHAMARASRTNDWGVMQQLARALEPYYRAVRRLGQPRTVKASMKLRGYAGTDAVRLPYVTLDDSEKAMLAQAVDESDASLRDLPIYEETVQA
jgi:4-hydroxy-tetrahydrodipicolinate synthase